jgi:hypothetical protein
MANNKIIIFMIIAVICCICSSIIGGGAAYYISQEESEEKSDKSGTGGGTTGGTGASGSTLTPAPIDWIDYDNFDLGQFDIGEGEIVSDYDACKAKCISDSTCYNIAFSKSDKKCWKKKPMEKSDVAYAFKAGTSMKTHSGKVDYPGFDMPGMPVKNTSLTDCSSKCLNDSSCQFINRVDNGDCWLKKLTPNNDRKVGFRIKGLTFT